MRMNKVLVIVRDELGVIIYEQPSLHTHPMRTGDGYPTVSVTEISYDDYIGIAEIQRYTTQSSYKKIGNYASTVEHVQPPPFALENCKKKSSSALFEIDSTHVFL